MPSPRANPAWVLPSTVRARTKRRPTARIHSGSRDTFTTGCFGCDDANVDIHIPLTSSTVCLYSGSMKDSEALDFLTDKLSDKTKVAAALGVSPQRLGNWYDRGISAAKRPAVWAMVNDHGGNLPREWLIDRARAA